MKFFYVTFLSLFLFSSSSQADLTDIECDEIWGKYTALVFKYKDTNTFNAGFYELSTQAHCYREIIRKLKIDYTMEQIREIYEKHGVLALRPLKGDKLLLGCGNNPVDPNFVTKPRHEHDDYDTVNPQISMNPSLVAAFGVNKLKGLLPNTYEELAFEAFTPIRTQEFLEAFNDHCSNVKAINDIDNPYSIDAPLTVDKLSNIEDIFDTSW